MKITRSVVLFTMGACGVTAETIYSLQYKRTPDPTLMVVFAAMMGLPIFLNQDGRRNKDDDDDEDKGTKASSRPVNRPKN